VPAAETTQPDAVPAEPVAAEPVDEDPRFPVLEPVALPQAEKSWFGPEISLEETRADADSRAAAAEHTTDEPVDDLLDVWVLTESRPSFVS
jgi:hypothetical protein